MTEEATGRGELAPHWPEKSRDRGVSPTPTKLEPHPANEEHPQWDGLPPCEQGRATDKPCSRSAQWHYGFGYYCEPHLEAIQAGEDYDEANLAVYHARRFMWKASSEGIERLEHHIGTALSELVEEQQQAEKRMNAWHEKVDAQDVR